MKQVDQNLLDILHDGLEQNIWSVILLSLNFCEYIILKVHIYEQNIDDK